MLYTCACTTWKNGLVHEANISIFQLLQVLDSDVHAEALTVMEGQTDTNDAVIIKSMSKVHVYSIQIIMYAHM